MDDTLLGEINAALDLLEEDVKEWIKENTTWWNRLLWGRLFASPVVIKRKSGLRRIKGHAYQVRMNILRNQRLSDVDAERLWDILREEMNRFRGTYLQ